jgi:hypothetical protein
MDVLSSSSRLRELRCKALDPPVGADVVHLDPALGKELLDVPVGEAEAQVPADRQGDDLGREPVPEKADRSAGRRGGCRRDLIARVSLMRTPVANATLPCHR